MSTTDDADLDLGLWKYSDSLGSLPDEYEEIDEDERDERIEEARAELGEDVVVLGHNYQRESVTRHADFLGDSLELSRRAADADAPYVVFCGVTFMAETADVVTDDSQDVILPSMEASCPMAGMAEDIQVDGAWNELTEVVPPEDVLPVTYVNSYASLKATTAANDGACCTSSNASDVFEWALDRGEKVFFTPDRHLAHNTLHDLGYGEDDFVVWDPWKPELGGNTPEEIRDASFVLWEGFCQVHERFTVEDVETTRERDPEVNVIVHPECRREVVEAADISGSTSQIIDAVESAEPGSSWAIGTEIHLTRRLARENPDRDVYGLCSDECSDCNAMRQIDPDFLLYALESLVEDDVVNRIQVDEEDAEAAETAIQRMFDV